MIARQRGQMSPGGSAGQWGSRNRDGVRMGEPTRARGVSQAGETDSRTTMISNQSKEAGWGANTGLADSRNISAVRIKRALLAWRGAAGDRQVRWPLCDLRCTCPDRMSCPQSATNICLFPSSSVCDPIQEVDDICSSSHKEEVPGHLRQKMKKKAVWGAVRKSIWNDWIHLFWGDLMKCVNLPAQLSVSPHDLRTWVPPSSSSRKRKQKVPLLSVDWVEVINVWSGSVSTSWLGCAPPVVTESSECER